MKPITLKQLLNKKLKPTDWHEVIMHRVRTNVIDYEISDDAWNILVSDGISEGLSEFAVKLSDKIIGDLKKYNKKVGKSSKRSLQQSDNIFSSPLQVD